MRYKAEPIIKSTAIEALSILEPLYELVRAIVIQD
jgi:hypothetical protein